MVVNNRVAARSGTIGVSEICNDLGSFPTMRELNIPAIVANKLVLKNETLKMIRGACFSIKQAQQRFLDSYRMALSDNVPGWDRPLDKPMWKTDHRFSETLQEIEDSLKVILMQNGLTLPTWNRYKIAARRVLFGGVKSFSLAAQQNFTLAELKVIREKGETAAREIRAQKSLKTAAALVQKKTNSVIIPLPAPGEQPQDYLDGVGPRLVYVIEQVRSTLGEQAARELAEKLTTRHEDSETQ
jgi:hypothetical protein